METKYITTSGYNKFTSDIIHTKMKEKELVDKSDISRFIDNLVLGVQIKRQQHQQQNPNQKVSKIKEKYYKHFV